MTTAFDIRGATPAGSLLLATQRMAMFREDTLIGWAPGAGIVRLVLHASPEGRPLDESLGFLATNEMLFPPFGAPGAARGGVETNR